MEKFGFTRVELAVFKRLSTPQKIQDFLETLPVNFERDGETIRSPRRVLRDRTAHCLEGALFAAAALYVHGELPLIVNLKTTDRDVDHVLAVFRRSGRWGAITKTNHAVLRYREPVYKSIRELAMSYFHEYFLDDGKKTMRSFSKPLDLRKFNSRGWMTDEEDLWYVSKALDLVPHERILSLAALRGLRRADRIEIKAGKLTEWRER
jgi:hypothetical protein